MALSDCVKCWDTPCTCGHEYMNWTIERLEEQISMLQKVLNSKKPESTISDVVIKGIKKVM